jgi:hypothetical protein
MRREARHAVKMRAEARRSRTGAAHEPTMTLATLPKTPLSAQLKATVLTSV